MTFLANAKLHASTPIKGVPLLPRHSKTEDKDTKKILLREETHFAKCGDVDSSAHVGKVNVETSRPQSQSSTEPVVHRAGEPATLDPAKNEQLAGRSCHY